MDLENNINDTELKLEQADSEIKNAFEELKKTSKKYDADKRNPKIKRGTDIYEQRFREREEAYLQVIASKAAPKQLSLNK